MDQINTFRKTTVYERPGDRVLVLMSAGNLAITQGALNLLAERHANQHGDTSLHTCSNMFGAARCAGAALREIFSELPNPDGCSRRRRRRSRAVRFRPRRGCRAASKFPRGHR